MIDADGKVALSLLIIIWAFTFVWLIRRVSRRYKAALNSINSKYEQMERTDSDAILLASNGSGGWVFFSIIHISFSLFGIILLAVEDTDILGALFLVPFVMLLGPVFYLSTVYNDHMDYISNEGIERAWVLMYHTPLLVPWSTVTRVSKRVDYTKVGAFPKVIVRYGKGSMVFDLPHHPRSFLGAILHHVPPERIDKGIREWYETVLKS